MKRTKLILPFTVLGLLLSFSLVACDKGGGDSSSQISSQQERITISAFEDKSKIILGQNLQLTASVEGVTWSSLAEEIATVNASGLVTSVAVGNVTIKAVKEGYLDGSIALKVELEKITVTAAEDKVALLPEETVQLTASVAGVAWASSDDTVASVSAAGLVTAVKFGSATITASKDGFTAGTIALTVNRTAITATLHFEDADHFSADGWWDASNRGPGATPIYSKDAASDATCVAYFGTGDKETLTFTSDVAVAAELVATMGNSSSFEDLSTVETLKFNGADVSLAGVAYTMVGEGSGNYTFTQVSLGNVNLVVGNNVLEFSFLASAPYLDDLQIYAEAAAVIAVVAAPAKDTIVVAEAALTVEEQSTVQIVTETVGVSYISTSEANATVDSSGLVTGIAAGSANITVLKAGMISTRVAITVTQKLVAGEIMIEAETGTSVDNVVTFRTPSAQTNASGNITDAFPVDATLTLTFTVESAGVMNLSLRARAARAAGSYTYTDVNLTTDCEIKFNGTAIVSEVIITGGTLTMIDLGNVNVLAGENTITVKAIVAAPTLDYFKLTPIPVE